MSIRTIKIARWAASPRCNSPRRTAQLLYVPKAIRRSAMTTKNLLRWSAIFATFVFSLSLACNDRRGSEKQPSIEDVTPAEKVAVPEYEIVDEQVYDAPVKTQVEQHIVVTVEITEENLRALLRQQHYAVSKRTGFKYHESPTNIYIYVYETKDKAKAGQGLWLAMSQMSYGDTEPQVNVRTDQIARLGQESQKRFGLSEVERQNVFREIARVEKKATDEAMKRFPSDINNQIDLERKLQEKYKDELAAKYHLTRYQLQSIMVEGVKNRWRY